ncbi:MAG: zinc ABC transporter substrate-binding protein [Candidatus Sericytochromatia bacterium]|nr:zinc ABC transporter substrate-binding protein [Candidatus Tanganyikabacteria bacterium]
MFRFLFRLVAIAALLATVPGGTAAAAGKVQVVASLPDLAAVAREVGGDRVEVTALAEATQDPHHVDARPHLILKLNRADLLIQAGMELEVGWLPVLVRGARNPRIYAGAAGHMDASAAIRAKDVPAGKVDRTMGDVHPSGNPHYMSDPRNAAAMARALADRLAKLDPGDGPGYRARAEEFERRARAAAAREAARFGALPAARRRIITYDRSLTYLVDWLGLSAVGELEPKPGIPPSPAHVAQVIATIREMGVPAIVQEAYYPRRTAELVARRSGAKLVALPGFPDFSGGQDYLTYMGKLADQLYAALEPGP